MFQLQEERAKGIRAYAISKEAMKQEAHFTTKFRNFARDRIGTGAYEIKHTRGENRFLMSELHEHQRDALLAVRNHIGMSYKIPDDSVAFKPFDMFVLKEAAAWVVICYPKEFVVIDINKIVKWKEPSLSLKDAVQMCSFLLPLSELNY